MASYMKKTDLKPCPFCGKIPEISGRKIKEFYGGKWMETENIQYFILPRCESFCLFREIVFSAIRHGSISDMSYSTPEKIADAWNKRTKDDTD